MTAPRIAQLLAGLTLAFAALPAAAAPATDAQCLQAWPQAKSPSKAQTEACIDLLLTHAYGGRKPDAEALTLDPAVDSPVEVALETSALQAIKAHIAGCAPMKGETEDWRCTRIHEYVDGMIARKHSTDDQGGLESLAPALAIVLKGEKLGRDDLEAEGLARFSPLGLWKLRNAAYARHGFAFKKPDLNTFFYGPRPEGVSYLGADDSEYKGILPVPRGEKAKVELSPVDGENIRLIKSMEGKLTAASKRRARK